MGWEWVAIAVSLILGGSGLTGVIAMARKKGKEEGASEKEIENLKAQVAMNSATRVQFEALTVTMKKVEEAINGPLQKKFDSVKEDSKETRELAEKALKEISERAEMCGSHETGLKFIVDTMKELKEELGFIKRRLERSKGGPV